MRVGIDSYSYHRRYGEIRSGEEAPSDPAWALMPGPVIEHARSLGVDELFLETCYLPRPESIDGDLLGLPQPFDLRFSWGHPWPADRYHGLDGGRTPATEVDLGRWIDAAARMGHPLMRITLGSPASRGDESAELLIQRLIEPVRRVSDRAAEVGLSLAIENHGDLTASQLRDLIMRVERPNLGVTLDNVNLIRLGDEMLAGTETLAPFTLMVQLKDHLPGDPYAWGGPVCTALGDGIADLNGILAILVDAGFDGPVCVELASVGGGDIDEFAMIERSVRWLREHVPN